ncbi:hypothetical protein HZA33_02865 [Candidatus Pacearchaeota archaeon]|nr:hypothetical protein [Candidatus Pacearchaeota archaeon]
MKRITEEIITVATPFNGKWYSLDSYLKALGGLDFDKKRIQLIFYDNSKDKKFGKFLKLWLEKRKKRYNLTNYIEDNSKSYKREKTEISGKEDWGILNNVARIYNEILKKVDGDYLFLIEDDVIVPKASLKKLLKVIKKKNIAAAGGYYLDRWAEEDFVAPYVWQYYDSNKRKDGLLIHALPKEKGVEEVTALGMGCYLIKTGIIKKLGFNSGYGNFKGADIILGIKINKKLKMKTLVDWSIQCRHLHYKNGKVLIIGNDNIDDLRIKTVNHIVQQIEIMKQEEINQRDKIISEKEEEINQRDKIIKEKEVEIKKIHNSRGWKFLTTIHKTKKKLGMIKND